MLAWISDHQSFLTILVAAYAAVVATAVAVWNIGREITNRGRLEVHVSGEGFYPGGGKKRLFCMVTNVGRQPIYLSCIGGQYRTKKHFILFSHSPLPMKLEPGASFNTTSDYEEELDRQGVSFLCAWDSLNRVHKMPKKGLKALLKDVESMKG